LRISIRKEKVKNLIRKIIDAVIPIYIKQFTTPDRAFVVVVGISGAGAVTKTSFSTFSLGRSILYAMRVTGICNSSYGVKHV